jgi:hypothetical protein
LDYRFKQYKPKSTAIFNELSIIATVATPVMEPEFQAKNTVYFPVSLKTSIMPLETEYYIYSEDINQNVTVYSLFLDNTEVELYSFAIWGRLFATDGQEADPPIEENTEPGFTEEPTTTEQDDSASAHLVAKILLIPSILLLMKL